MKPPTAFLAAVLLAASAVPARASITDSIFVLEPISVATTRMRFGTTTVTPGRADLERAFARLGVSAVRRGVPIASDLYAEGFKRADLAVTVDGERFHCACPNRMDPPTSLALPVEVASVTREMSAAAPGAGLAGRLAIERAPLNDPWRVTGGITGMAGHEDDLNAAIALEGRRQRVALRWAEGLSYRDGDGLDFGDRYGYRDDDVRYRQGDLSARGRLGALAWGGSYSLTRDVPYPYLQMDERENRIVNASLGAGGHKLYVTRSSHVMDAGLRRSSMAMRTDATQVTVGWAGRAAGVELEAFGRGWNADNVIGAGMSAVKNHLIPDYRQWSLAAARSHAFGAWQAAVRAGITRLGIADETALAHHRLVVPDARDERWFTPFSASLGRTARVAAGVTAGFGAELASEPPTAEQLWITVRRPAAMAGMARPDWIGRTDLRAPLRASLRSAIARGGATLSGHVSYLDAYVLPTATRAGMTRILTYRGGRALIAAASLRGEQGPFEGSLDWVSGQNLDDDGPLAEMAPVTASLAWRSPPVAGVRGFVRGVAAARAWRVDRSLGETPGDAWARLDLGAEWRGANGVSVSAEVENVTDATYTQHLAYLRDPFASGARVYEPGRLLRASVTFGR